MVGFKLPLVAVLGLATLSLVSADTTITISNNCTTTIDPAFFPAAQGGIGGFSLGPKLTSTVTLSPTFSGRIWGRTGCSDTGVCTTGTCPGGINCTGPAAAGPSLAQFTLDGFASLDFFNPTVGDGFNLAITIIPGGSCTTAPVACTDAAGDGNGCGDTSTCPTTTPYTIQFC